MMQYPSGSEPILQSIVGEQCSLLARSIKSVDTAWRLRYYELGWGKDGWGYFLPKEVACDPNLVFNIVTESIMDVLSVLITGPAYLYSSARLLYEQSYAGFSGKDWPASYYSSRRLSQSEHLPSLTRLLMLEYTLKSMKIPTRLHLPDVAQDEFLSAIYAFTKNLVKSVLPIFSSKFLYQPYNYREHLKIEDAKLALVTGEVIDCRPTTLLNALWDTVFDATSYANEMALVFSVLKYREASTR